VAVEVIVNDLLEHGIVPDFVVTLEGSSTSITHMMFDIKLWKPHNRKITLITSSITRHDIIEKIVNGADLSYLKFDFVEEPRCSNVGLFATNFAITWLCADDVVMIGMEHDGTKYPELVYKFWVVDFMYFTKKWPKGIITNCSGGVLFYEDYINKARLSDLVGI